jgi:protein YIPF1/2
MSSFETAEAEDIETTKFLREPKKAEHPDIPFCGCLSVRYYQPFFDVDTTDITSRLLSALFYCKREQNFLEQITDRPDAYGPFWVIGLLFGLSACVCN